jgi:hypothetical protein
VSLRHHEFQKNASRRGAAIPCPISAVTHFSGDRKLIYVSNNIKGDCSSQQYIYVCDGIPSEIDYNLSTQLSERLRRYVATTRDAPRHMCVCTIPSNTTLSSSGSGSGGVEGSDHQEEMAYLIVSLKSATNTIICMRIN